MLFWYGLCGCLVVSCGGVVFLLLFVSLFVACCFWMGGFCGVLGLGVVLESVVFFFVWWLWGWFCSVLCCLLVFGLVWFGVLLWFCVVGGFGS